MEPKIPEPKISEKLGFACGDYSISFIWQTMMFFLPFFYTDTFGLSPAFIATMFFGVRIVDAVTDPLCGVLCDRTVTRWGKYRPYLLWFCIPFAVFIVLMFSTPSVGMGGKQIYAVATYLGMMLVYTLVSTPYNCLLGVISSNQEVRTSASTYRFVFAYAAGLSVQLLVIPMVQKFGEGNASTGYQLSMGVFALLAVIGLLITFFSVKERVQPPEKKSSIKEDFSDVLQNGPWKILFGLTTISLTYIAIRSASVAYFFKYYLDRELQMGVFLATGTVFVILGVIPSKFLASKFGKAKVMQYCMSVILLSMIAFFFLDENDLVLMYVLQIIFSLASGPVFPLLWSMFADTADYSEWKTGRRATGLLFSAGSFAIKMGFAIGGTLVMWTLSLFNFTANQIQDDLSLMGIRLCMTFVPAAILALGMILFTQYKLNDDLLGQIAIDLEKRRGKE